MKVVITGFDSRAASPATANNYMSMGALLSRTFQLRGHKVHQHGCWSFDGTCKDILDDADLILMGLSSPLALSSYYANGALSVLYTHWLRKGKMRMFVDDPDITKWKHGAVSTFRRWRENHDDALMGNPAFLSRKHREGGVEKRTQLYLATEMMAMMNDLPALGETPIFVPKNNWMTGAETPMHYVGIDFGEIAADWLTREHPHDHPARSDTRARAWYVEKNRADAWAKKVSLRYPVEIGTKKAASDRMSSYRHFYGVLESPQSAQVGGWWTPTAALAGHSGTPYFTDLGTSVHYDHVRSSPLYEIPSNVESMDTHEYARHARDQVAFLRSYADSPEDIIERIMNR
jgi:hypothetical protein